MYGDGKVVRERGGRVGTACSWLEANDMAAGMRSVPLVFYK